MTEVLTAHTARLRPAVLAQCRALLVEVFDGDFGDADWDHTTGGLHVLVSEDSQLVAHGSLVLRRLLYGGRALRTGYVEGVAVRADHQGQGYGALVMDSLEDAVRSAYELGALSATDLAAGIYAARGWLRWRGPTSVLAPDGLKRTPDDDGGVYVLPVAAALDLDAPIACDWRDGDVW